MSVIQSCCVALGSRSATSFGSARKRTVRSIVTSMHGTASTARPIHARRSAVGEAVELMACPFESLFPALTDTTDERARNRHAAEEISRGSLRGGRAWLSWTEAKRGAPMAMPSTVDDYMSSNVSPVREDTTLIAAAQQMRISGVGGVPVLDSAGEECVGILTERDIVIR